jgi:alkyl sulfatase BDS1-like metallo-beta-lactamase superfamily hydrolase
MILFPIVVRMAAEHFSPSFADRTDFESASRGFIAALEPCIVKAANGRVVWNNDAYHFMQDSCPPTANPKLWRQGQLNSIQGLFEVTPGIYQIRGLDLSNMTVVEGKQGIIVIDPLISNECAAAALNLYRTHRGDRPVTGLIYSHSHVDHFGGAQGVLRHSPLGDYSIPIIAPEGFMEEATSENIYAGPSMRRRAAYMYGTNLPKSASGQIGCGLGMATSSGTNSLVPPNVLIRSTGEEMIVDGVRIVFQVVPGTEAPAEINFYFPERRALCIAECATHCLHNIITLRGALVRDAKAWSSYLDETLTLFGAKSTVLFAGHNWPTFGTDAISKLVAEQRDLYAYLHDQTVRMMNQGLTGIEIAEVLTLPPALQSAWHAQGYYGSVSHNVKGIYQRYMTWFDGDPAHLWQYPPAEEGRRYIACFGGVDALIQKAEFFTQEGDLRFACTLLGHGVAAQPEHQRARAALADVFERLGFGAENATWRNFYLSGALDLRSGRSKAKRSTLTAMTTLNPLLSVEQWLEGLSVQIDGPRAAREKEPFVIDVLVTDEGRRWRLSLSNGVLWYRSRPKDKGADTIKMAPGLSLMLSKAELLEVLRGDLALLQRPGGKNIEGDERLLHRLVSLFSVVEPTSAGESHL